MLQIRWSRDTAVPAAAALAWWFDVQENDHAPPRRASGGKAQKAGEGREILSRTDTEAVVRDTWGRMKLETTILRDAGALVYESRGSGYGASGQLTVEPRGEGSRLVYETDLVPDGFLGKVMLALAAGRMRKMIEDDLENHALDMEDDWAAAPW